PKFDREDGEVAALPGGGGEPGLDARLERFELCNEALHVLGGLERPLGPEGFFEGGAELAAGARPFDIETAGDQEEPREGDIGQTFHEAGRSVPESLQRRKTRRGAGGRRGDETWPECPESGRARMMATDLEPALTTILAQAEALARSRGEETSTVHVLAMLGSPSGPTAEVLAERGARPRKVLDVAERLVPGPVDHLPLFASRVREYARRFGAGTPRAAHCLLVILNDTSLSAHRVLVELGVNIASARGAA